MSDCRIQMPVYEKPKRSDVDFSHEFVANNDGVLPCLCGAYPILVEAEDSHGAMGYVCLECPACMKPRRRRKDKTAEQVALEAWNTRATLGAGECDKYAEETSTKNLLENMLREMSELSERGRREWCGRSHGEYGIFLDLGDFAEKTRQRMDESWLWN